MIVAHQLVPPFAQSCFSCNLLQKDFTQSWHNHNQLLLRMYWPSCWPYNVCGTYCLISPSQSSPRSLHSLMHHILWQSIWSLPGKYYIIYIIPSHVHLWCTDHHADPVNMWTYCLIFLSRSVAHFVPSTLINNSLCHTLWHTQFGHFQVSIIYFHMFAFDMFIINVI